MWKCLGVTLSTEQLALARQRAIERGLDNRVRFELKDYRDVEGTFDRIVSVGMFEHVGIVHYDEFFAKVRDLLKPDGVALLAFHWPQRRARRYRPLDAEIYFPRRLFPRPFGGHGKRRAFQACG